jgi:coenzyme F420 biosynthesis associated uncharacterized protein
MAGRRRALQRSAGFAALSGLAALSVRALARPRPASEGSRRGLVDWDVVRRTARARSGQRGGLDPSRAAELASLYDRFAVELAPWMAEVCGPMPAVLPRFTVLDRHGFIDANLAIARRLLDPVEELRSAPESALTDVGRRVTSRYLGELFGLMSQRVLGQFDPVLMLPGPALTDRPPTTLYMVEPNIEGFRRGQRVPGEPLRRWLILHEATHAWQFQAHPWLGPHIEGLMRELVMSGIEAQRGAGWAKPGDWGAALRRAGGILTTQLRGIGRLQAMMSVIEGYSNFMMHRVGRAHIAEFDELETAFERRQGDRTLLERLILALSGIAVKLRQYQLGESFCDAVAATGGTDLLNRVWEAPEMMPSLAELRRPERWVARVRAGG